MIQVYPDADLDELLLKMRDLGITAKTIAGARHNPFFSRVRLLLTPAEIAALREPLAGLRDVFWIDLEGRRTLLNDTTVWVGQSGLSRRPHGCRSSPRGFGRRRCHRPVLNRASA